MVADAHFHPINLEITQQNGNFAAQSGPRVCVKATDSFKQSEGVGVPEVWWHQNLLPGSEDGS